MSERKIFFVRHGESEANANQVFAGQRDDSPLTEVGRKQAQIAAKEIVERGIKIERIVVSPLLRARETAEIIIREAGLEEIELAVDARIAEYDMGEFTGTPLRRISADERARARDVEDPARFMERVHKLLDELGGNTLLVSHAGVGRVIEAKRQGKRAEEFYDLEAYPNAKVIELLYYSPTN